MPSCQVHICRLLFIYMLTVVSSLEWETENTTDSFMDSYVECSSVYTPDGNLLLWLESAFTELVRFTNLQLVFASLSDIEKWHFNSIYGCIEEQEVQNVTHTSIINLIILYIPIDTFSMFPNLNSLDIKYAIFYEEIWKLFDTYPKK